MFLAHPSRLPANIVFRVVLMFLIFEQLCKHKSHVFRQSMRWPLVKTNQLSALRFDNNAHGDKKLTTRRDELEFIPAEFFVRRTDSFFITHVCDHLWKKFIESLTLVAIFLVALFLKPCFSFSLYIFLGGGNQSVLHVRCRYIATSNTTSGI